LFFSAEGASMDLGRVWMIAGRGSQKRGKWKREGEWPSSYVVLSFLKLPERHDVEKLERRRIDASVSGSDCLAGTVYCSTGTEQAQTGGEGAQRE
jgi:hypothetical protein